MTYNEFCALCAEYTIEPCVALENEKIETAVRVLQGDVQIKVIRELLESEF